MKEILNFIQSHRNVSLATVSPSGKATVRLFQIMKTSDSTLYFATGRFKEVYEHLQNNPECELLGYHKNISVRVSGEAKFEVPENICREIFHANPILGQIYHSFDNRDLVYFSIRINKAELFDLNQIPPKRLVYESQT